MYEIMTANYCILIGEDLIAVGSAFGIDRKVLVLFPEAFILVFLQTAEHTAIVHVVSVNDVQKKFSSDCVTAQSEEDFLPTDFHIYSQNNLNIFISN